MPSKLPEKIPVRHFADDDLVAWFRAEMTRCGITNKNPKTRELRKKMVRRLRSNRFTGQSLDEVTAYFLSKVPKS